MPAEVAEEVTGRRFIIACDRGALRLVGSEVVLGRVRCSDSLDDRSGRPGLWYELRDEHGKPLWRRIVFGRPMARRETVGRSRSIGGGVQRTFDVVVPTVTGAVTLAIVGPRSGDPTSPSVDLAVLALDRV